eukprot:scaffold116778_cov90-Cyclotella_meneghiniana.AAC.1
MFEMQLFSAGVNVALNGTANQSSTLQTWNASNAIDNDPSTFSHTGLGDKNAWWELELNENHVLDHLTVVNRYCQDVNDAPACLCRLSNATILLLDENDVVVRTESLGDTCNQLELDLDLSSCADTMPPSASPTLKPTTASSSSFPSMMPSASPTLKPITASPSSSPSTMPSASPTLKPVTA